MKKPQYLLLGIDGGGTKTDVILADETETILARVKTGPTNMHTVSEKNATKHLKEAKIKLYKKAKVSPSRKLDAIGGGFAGIDHPGDLKKAQTVISKAFGKLTPSKKHFQVVNDTIIGFWSGTNSKEGICIIGGTGSNCYGRTRRGREAWAGGLDWKLSDEGSGFEQGWKALRAAVKSSDGRGPKSLLEKMILRHYQVKTIRELAGVVYKPGYGKSDFGELALLIQHAAMAGDAEATRICKESAEELVLLVKAVATKLNFKKAHHFDLVLIGGVIQRNPIVHDLFKRQMRKHYSRINFIVPSDKPAMGAVRLGKSTLKI